MTQNAFNDSRSEEVWALGAAYDPYVGRWSRLIAQQFIEWLSIPSGRRWLDVGCGTGALTQTILRDAAPSHVHGVDAAPDYLDFARQQTADDRATFQLGDAQSLPVETAAFHATVSGLMLNFLLRPEQALAEMARATQAGGVVAVYVWDYAGRMQFMRHFWNAAAANDPSAATFDEGLRFPLCQPDTLATLFQSTGLSNVETRAIDVWTVFRDFDDYWSPFLGGQGPAPGYLTTLDKTARAALRERIRAALPFACDGSIPLMARAWTVRGFR